MHDIRHAIVNQVEVGYRFKRRASLDPSFVDGKRDWFIRAELTVLTALIQLLSESADVLGMGLFRPQVQNGAH
jgi:hypothetical protein